jgi:hypothetical protein
MTNRLYPLHIHIRDHETLAREYELAKKWDYSQDFTARCIEYAIKYSNTSDGKFDKLAIESSGHNWLELDDRQYDSMISQLFPNIILESIPHLQAENKKILALLTAEQLLRCDIAVKLMSALLEDPRISMDTFFLFGNEGFKHQDFVQLTI